MYRFFNLNSRDETQDVLRGRVHSVLKRGDIKKLAKQLKESECIEQECKDAIFVTLMHKWVARSNVVLQNNKKIIIRTMEGGSKVNVPVQIESLFTEESTFSLSMGQALIYNVYKTVDTTFNMKNGDRKRIHDEFIDDLLRQVSEFLSAYDNRFKRLSNNDCFVSHGRAVRLKPINEIPFWERELVESRIPMVLMGK